MLKKWNEIELEINLKSCYYEIRIANIKLKKCKVKILTASNKVCETFNWSLLSNSDNNLDIKMETELGIGMLSFSPCANLNKLSGIEIHFKIIDKAKEASIYKLIPLHIDELSSDHILVHGRKMGGCQMIKTMDKELDFSCVYQCISTFNNISLQMTHPMRQKNHSDFSGHICSNKVINYQASTEFCQGNIDTDLIAEPIAIYASSDGHSLMQAYGLKEKMSKNKTIHLAAGWNSWDYYRWTITEEEVLNNANFIRNDNILGKHIKRITIDDGWQYCYGEWDANPLFSNGMKKLAEKLTEMGFEPGLWLAPTIFEPHSRIAQVQSEMLALGKSGLPCLGYSCMERKGFLLDPTRDDSREWLYKLFAKYVNYGYKFFKLDFLAQTLNAVKFYDSSVGRGEIIRKILEPIREATEGKAILLGCNYTFEAGDELVDSVRVSGDIHADWNCIKHNSPSIAARFWTQNVLWDNDPDFALVRGPETSNDSNLHSLKPCLVSIKPDSPYEKAKNNLNTFDTANKEELKTLLGLVIISGGCVNLSDNIPLLNKQGLELVRKTVAVERGEAGLPLDLFQSDFPAIWIQKTKTGHRILLINWENNEKQATFDLTQHQITGKKVVDFWTEKQMIIKNNVISIDLLPHTSLLLEIK